MLDYHLQKLFQEKFYGTSTSIDELIGYLGVDDQRLRQQLRVVNAFLRENVHPEILYLNNKIEMPKKITFSWAELKYLTTRQEIVFSETNRQQLIYLYCFLESDNLSVFHFQDFLQVSKNTILADIKKLRKQLTDWGISLSYKRSRGFYLDGDELKIRVLGRNFVSMLMENKTGFWGLVELKSQLPSDRYLIIRHQLKKVLDEQGMVIVPSRVEEVSHYMTLLSNRVAKERIGFIKSEEELLESLQNTKAARQFINAVPFFNYPNEVLFITSLFMTVVEGSIRDPAVKHLLICTNQIIQRLQTISAIDFKERDRIVLHTFYHLVPSFFRIYFDYHLPNAWTDIVKRRHSDLFKLTKIALEPLEKITNKPIPENEVAYFTILFGGEIERQKETRTEVMRALILCPNGISSSLIMQTELKQLFPMIDFSLTNSINELENIPEDKYDVIFTNIELISNKPVYLISPIMTMQEKQRLLINVQEKLLVPGLSVLSPAQIISLIEPYVTFKEGASAEKLVNILTNRMINRQKKKEDLRPMLSELITDETIQITDEKLTWEEAIAHVAQPLLDQGKIEERYVTAMIDKVKDYGAFIHIGKNVALPHARPEDGVKELGMSLLKTAEPVLLLENEKHPITLFICLAAVDNEAHLRALMSLTKILSNSKNLENLLTATTKTEIKAILKGEDE